MSKRSTRKTSKKPEGRDSHDSVNELMLRGTALQAEGMAAEATAIYRQVLAREPNHLAALGNLGVILDIAGDPEGEAIFRRVVALAPGRAEGWNNLGRCLRAKGKIDLARGCFEKAVALRPDYSVAWNNLRNLDAGIDGSQAEVPLLLARGDALRGISRWDEAAVAFRGALALDDGNVAAWRGLVTSLFKAGHPVDVETEARRFIERLPHCADAWQALGAALAGQRRFDEAMVAYDKAVSLAPGDFDVLHNRGIAAYWGKYFDVAERSLRDALSIDPASVAALNNLGNVLSAQGRDEEAIEVIARGLDNSPEDIDLLNSLGLAYARLQRFDESQQVLQKAAELAPQSPEVLSNLGKVFMDTQKFDQAMTCFDGALSARPDFAIAKYNAGLALNQIGRFDDAASALRASIALDPLFRPPHHNLGLLELTLGHFEIGWREYQWRPARLQYEKGGRDWHPSLPPSLPESFDGEWVYLVGEQGIGDELFFLRFAPQLKARGARLVYRPTLAKLKKLLEGCGLFDKVLDANQEIESGYAMRCMVGDLPLLLGMKSVDDIPPPLPLMPDPQRVARFYLDWLDKFPPPYIGVAWRGGVKNEKKDPDDTYRSLFKEVDLDTLVAEFSGLAATLVVLQRNPRAEEVAYLADRVGCPVVNCADFNDDLETMLAALSVLDDMVGVSNTNYHLRASLGKGGRVLVPKLAEFRWLTGSKTSPWFPGMTLYRESFTDGWEPALRQLRGDLESILAPTRNLHFPSRS